MALLICWLVASPAPTADPAIAASQPGTESSTQRAIRVGIYDNPPLVFLDKDGKAQGIYPDLLDEIAAREGWRIRYVKLTFEQGLERLASGDIDVMTAIAHTEERAERYLFTGVNVLANWGQVYVPRTSAEATTALESVLDLAGRRIAVVKGDVYYEGLSSLFEQFDLEASFVEVDEYPHVMEQLDRGSVDAGVVSRIFGHQNAEDYAVRATPVVVKPVQLRFALSKLSPNNVRIAERIDAHLRELKDRPDSAYYESVDRWLGQTPSQRRMSRRLLWALAGVAALLGIAVAFGVLLRLQVRARTAQLEQKTTALEREVSERERAQKALTQSEELFKTIVQTSTDGILLADLEGRRLKAANQAICDMLGYTRAEIEELDVGDIHPKEALPSVIAHFEAQVRGDYALAPDVPVLRKDGSVFLADISSSPMVVDGKATLVGFFRDVTAKRELEQLKSDFLSMVSHELRTPLAVIIGHATLVDRLAETGLTEQLLRSLKTIRARGAEMHRMVDQLLSVMSIESGSFALKEELTAVSSVIERAMDILPERCQAVIDVRVEEETPPIQCDPELMARAVSNLLDNAVKFSPEDGRVAVWATSRDGRTLISVTDRGVGIEAEDLPRLFRRFTQLDMSARRKYGGVGMGLFIVESIVQAHGGTVKVSSRPDEGSTFTIELPPSRGSDRMSAG